MSTINDTDLFLVERSGTSYKVEASDIDDAQSSDLFLVERSGTSYKLTKSNLDSDLDDTDLILVERSGTSYKVSGADFKDLFTTKTCGTFTVTTNTGSNPGTFLQSATCSNSSYIRDVTGEMYISCSTPFVVSANDTVSVRVNHDGSNSATINLVMPGETDLAIGSLGSGSAWQACDDTIWETVTLSTSGTITGLTVTGGNTSDAFGVGQMKINGDLIYSGSTYETGIN